MWRAQTLGKGLDQLDYCDTVVLTDLVQQSERMVLGGEPSVSSQNLVDFVSPSLDYLCESR
jgi:hypothetical protein